MPPKFNPNPASAAEAESFEIHFWESAMLRAAPADFGAPGSDHARLIAAIVRVLVRAGEASRLVAYIEASPEGRVVLGPELILTADTAERRQRWRRWLGELRDGEEE